jgi:hypothetical protein
LISPDRHYHLQDPDTLVWGPDSFPDAYRARDAIVYGICIGITLSKNESDRFLAVRQGQPETLRVDTVFSRSADGHAISIFQSKKYTAKNGTS